MAEIIKACQSGEIPNLEVACIISSSPKALGIAKAKNLNISPENIMVINPNNFRNQFQKIDQTAFGLALIKELKSRGVTLVTQNGWLPFTPEIVLDAFPNAIFNQHPGPVPEFGGKGMYGIRVHEAIINFSRKTGRIDPWTEVIGQRVANKYDAGAVIKSARVKIFKNDTAETLRARALPVEHRVQIDMLKDIMANCIVAKNKTEILVHPGQEEILIEAKQSAINKYPLG